MSLVTEYEGTNYALKIDKADEVLWSGSEFGNITISLSHSIRDFKYLIVIMESGTISTIPIVDDVTSYTSSSIMQGDNAQRTISVILTINSNTSIKVVCPYLYHVYSNGHTDANAMYINKVIGRY